MCGVAGFTHRNRSTDGKIIKRATASLVHRGPDQQSVYVSTNVCLGAVRLQIIDREGGYQPLVSADRSTVVAYNGEVYNHDELRKELQQLGHTFRSRCDTEVVLEAFLEWDTACFKRFRGMFAIAIWSERRRRLVLARDRMGIKPLYICTQGQELHFGSELKAILAHPDIPRRLDREALNDFLSFNYVPGARTLIEGITKLPPGFFLTHENGASEVKPYWHADFTPQTGLSVHEAQHELDGLLRASIREHLSADVPVGFWLSGGIDSSTILHYASEAGIRKPKTFSVAFESACCDERVHFREMAARYGAEHSEFELRSGSNLRDAVEDCTFYSDEPAADAGALPIWFLSKMTAKHVTVALSGDGGDELFGGYVTYLADKIARPLRAVPYPFRRFALRAANHLLPVSDKKIAFEYKLKRLLEGSFLPPDEAHGFWNGAFSREQRARMLRDLPHPLIEQERRKAYASFRGEGWLNRQLSYDQRTYLPDNILYKVDRMSMAHSLEVRPAFLDHRIVEFAARLPENMKIRGGTLKFLLKKTMKNKLPAGVLTRKKQGFDIPTHSWFRSALKPLLLEVLSPEAVRQTGLFNEGVVQQYITDHLERRANLGYHLWGLMTLCLWLKRWDIETATEPEYSRELATAAYGT